jgi:ABC-type antimicrobial peptide transport system permease subunit
LFNIEYFIIFGLIMLGIMVIFGLLPIYTLLKKTPSEICAKYDI